MNRPIFEPNSDTPAEESRRTPPSPTGPKARLAAPTSPGLAPPRFGLKALFLAISGSAALLAVWQWLGPALGVVFLLGLLVVFAHVAGTAIGAKLRANSGAASRPESDISRSSQTQPRHEIHPDQFAPVTKLSHRAPLGSSTAIVTFIGGVVGAGGGVFLMRRSYPELFSIESIVVSGLAGATMGAFWAFWIFSLAQVLGGAWWQAHRNNPRTRH